MDKVHCSLTVFFEKPFWVGIFEKIENKKISVCKVTFGAEPKDYEIYDFILTHYCNLQYSLAIDAIMKETKKNPKRMQREVKKQLKEIGIGTKSQQALKQQQELTKTERKLKRRQQKVAKAEQLFEQKQQKKKEKHRGH